MFFAFPIDDLLDDFRCYRWLLEKRWPGGKPVCPRCAQTERTHVHNRDQAPVEDFRCKACRRVVSIHGEREVHTNSTEGLWTSLRNWPRSFRGVSKRHLQGYIWAFEWIWNRKRLDKADLHAVVLHQIQGGITYEPG